MRQSFPAALAVGFLLRAFFVWHHPRFAGDTLVYGDIAHNLLQHGVYGLTEAQVRPTLIRLPGYPLFLAACFSVFGMSHYLPVLWVQVGFDLLGCVLLAEVARRTFGARGARSALWLGVLCPFTANYTAAALTETLSIFCVSLALWSMVHWWRALRGTGNPAGFALLIGLALTGAALLRPDGGLLAAAVVPAMLWAGLTGGKLRRAAAGALMASAMLVLALGLWTARNWEVLRAFQPLAPKYANDPGESAPLGFARWYRTWATDFRDTVRVYWIYDGDPLCMQDLPPWAFDNSAQRQQTAELYARYNAVTSSTPAIEADFASLARQRIRAHPLRYYVLLPAARLADMWLRPRTAEMRMPLDWWNVRAHPRRSAFQIGYAVLNLGLLVLAVIGLLRWRRLRWGADAPVVAAGVAFVLLRSAMLLTIDNSEPRYTLECFPVVLLLAAMALSGSEQHKLKSGSAPTLSAARE